MKSYDPFLLSLGWNDFFQSSFDKIHENGLYPARILSQGREKSTTQYLMILGVQILVGSAYAQASGPTQWECSGRLVSTDFTKTISLDGTTTLLAQDGQKTLNISGNGTTLVLTQSDAASVVVEGSGIVLSDPNSNLLVKCQRTL